MSSFKLVSVFILFSILLLLVPTTLAVLCGTCVGRGDVCNGARGVNCGDNLVCKTTEQAGSPSICLPSIEEGKPCTSVGVDTCEVDYVCNRSGSGNCDFAHGTLRSLGDYCGDDSWCGTGLQCSGSKCVLTGTCTLALSGSGCVINKYCNLDTCTDKAGDGADCTTAPCLNYLFCDTNDVTLEKKCRSLFSKAEGDNCTATSQCKTGLTCNCLGTGCQKKCVKPVYFFLPATGGVVWGDDCDPKAGVSGCTCNYESHSFRYLKEYSDLYDPACLTNFQNYFKCLTDNGCSTNLMYARSCARNNCYGLFRGFYQACLGQPSLIPPICSAQALASALFGVLIAILVL